MDLKTKVAAALLIAGSIATGTFFFLRRGDATLKTRVVPTKPPAELARESALAKRLSRIHQPVRLVPEDTVWRVPVDADDPVVGPTDAPVTIVEFCHYEGPRCRELEPNLEAAVRKANGAARLVWKDAPAGRHVRGQLASLFIRQLYIERGSEAFWSAHRRLFAELLSYTDPLSDSLATALRLDASTKQHAEEASLKLERSMVLAVALEIKETPVLFINGRRVTGSHPIDMLEQLIKDELGRLDAEAPKPYVDLVAAGREPDFANAEKAVAFASQSRVQRKEKANRGELTHPLLAPLPDYEVSEAELQAIEKQGFRREAYVELVRNKKRAADKIAEMEAARAEQGFDDLPKPTPRQP